MNCQGHMLLSDGAGARNPDIWLLSFYHMMLPLLNQWSSFSFSALPQPSCLCATWFRTPVTFHREIYQSQVQSTKKIHCCGIKAAVLVKTLFEAYPTPYTQRGKKLRVRKLCEELGNCKTKRNRNDYMFHLHSSRKESWRKHMGLPKTYVCSQCLPSPNFMVFSDCLFVCFSE